MGNACPGIFIEHGPRSKSTVPSSFCISPASSARESWFETNRYPCTPKRSVALTRASSPKDCSSGRAFQLGRIEGNFLLAGWCSSIRMEDKASLRPMIVEHQHLFGKGVLKSLGTDKGYYSEANRRYLRWLEELEEFCLPQPGLDSEHQSPNATAIQARLLDRRSGIEPLIGHAKQGGQLGKSRMKKDETTLAAGYAS